LELLQHIDVKESRTDRLLRELKILDGFLDAKLPSGYMSISQLNAYANACARAYQYRYVDREPGRRSGAMSRGVAVHNGIETLLRKKLNKEAITADTIKETEALVEDSYMRMAADVTRWDGEDNINSVKEETLRYYNLFVKDALPKLNPIAIEKGFAVKFGEVPVIGWIDMVDNVPAIPTERLAPEYADQGPIKKVVVDFKTARAKWSPQDLARDVQLTAYSMVEGTPFVRVDQLINYKAKSKQATFLQEEAVRTPEDGAILVDFFGETADLIKKGVFPKVSPEHWSCSEKHCPYWSKCRGKKIAVEVPSKF